MKGNVDAKKKNGIAATPVKSVSTTVENKIRSSESKERRSNHESPIPKIQVRTNENADGLSTRDVRLTDKRRRSEENNIRSTTTNGREKRQCIENDSMESNDRNLRARQRGSGGNNSVENTRDYPVRGSRRQDENAAALQLRREMNIPPNRPLSDSYIPSRDNNNGIFSTLLTYFSFFFVHHLCIYL